jgi:hypothetical protein
MLFSFRFSEERSQALRTRAFDLGYGAPWGSLRHRVSSALLGQINSSYGAAQEREQAGLPLWARTDLFVGDRLRWYWKARAAARRAGFR